MHRAHARRTAPPSFIRLVASMAQRVTTPGTPRAIILGSPQTLLWSSARCSASRRVTAQGSNPAWIAARTAYFGCTAVATTSVLQASYTSGIEHMSNTNITNNDRRHQRHRRCRRRRLRALNMTWADPRWRTPTFNHQLYPATRTKKTLLQIAARDAAVVVNALPSYGFRATAISRAQGTHSYPTHLGVSRTYVKRLQCPRRRVNLLHLLCLRLCPHHCHHCFHHCFHLRSHPRPSRHHRRHRRHCARGCMA